MPEPENPPGPPPASLDLLIRRSNRLAIGVVAFCLGIFAVWAVLLRGAPGFLAHRMSGTTVGLLIYLAVLVGCFVACCWYSRQRRRRIDPHIALIAKEAKEEPRA